MPRLDVVLVDDCEDDFVLVRDLLGSIAHLDVEVTWAETYDAGLVALSRPHDIGLVDYRLGVRDGLHLTDTMVGRGHRTPIILLTGQGDRSVDLRAMKSGASDCLVKGEITAPVLERAIRYAIDRKRAETALRDSEKSLEHSVSLLQATLEATADGIAVTDLAGAITNLSQRMRTLWRLPVDARCAHADEALALVIDQVTEPERLLRRVSELRARPGLEDQDIIEFNDGRVFELDSRPQLSAGVIAGRVWSCRDITERRQMQATLVASDRLASMGSLAAGIAHEINNPLAYVIANLSLLREKLPALAAAAGDLCVSEVDEILGDMAEGADRVRRVVRDLKVFSRSDEIETGPVELHPLLEFAINMAFTEIRHRARLVKDYGQDVPAVEGNRAKLGQVFLNLLVNAAQSIREGDVDRNEIRIVTRRDPLGRAVVEVHDTGQGIPADSLSRVFVPFFTTKAIGVGTGLGLSISQGIVSALGGCISVKSEVGRGTVFTVVLGSALSAPVSPRRSVSGLQVVMTRGRVLVVDDDPLVAKALRRLLESEHHVVTVTSGRAALAHLSSAETVDVILCDLMMPEMTGMDLHDELARLRPADAEKMVFVSGGAFTSRARDFLEDVPNERVEKPFDIGAVRALVRRLVGSARTRDGHELENGALSSAPTGHRDAC